MLIFFYFIFSISYSIKDVPGIYAIRNKYILYDKGLLRPDIYYSGADIYIIGFDYYIYYSLALIYFII